MKLGPPGHPGRALPPPGRCLCLKKPYLICITDSLALDAQPAAPELTIGPSSLLAGLCLQFHPT